MKLKDLKNQLDQLSEEELNQESQYGLNATGQLPSEIYVTYDRKDGEIFCAFVNKLQCENEAEECGCGMQIVRFITN